MKQKWMLAGCVCWIIGLILFLVGLNLTGSTKDWLVIAGNILFFFGLAIVGAMWLKKKKEEEKE